MKTKNKLPFKNKYLLAPMEEVNDVAFRLLCKKAGAGLTYTGLTTPLTQAEQFLEDKPGFQLFGVSSRGLRQFMKKYDSQVSLWDFNLGCPAKTAKKHGFGVYLTKLRIIEKILRIMRQSTKKPVTIKIRKSKISYDLLKLAEKYCDAITIHPRTASQGYSGKADTEFAEEFLAKSKIPVIYSGDVTERNADDFLKKGFAVVMIGREAIGRPEIFSKLNKTPAPKNLEFKDYLKLADKHEFPFRQLKFQAMQFTKGVKNSRKLRDKIARTKDIEEIKGLFGI